MKQVVLKTGAFDLSDDCICRIDKFEEMNENTRSASQNVMEQLTLLQRLGLFVSSMHAPVSWQQQILLSLNKILKKQPWVISSYSHVIIRVWFDLPHAGPSGWSLWQASGSPPHGSVLPEQGASGEEVHKHGSIEELHCLCSQHGHVLLTEPARQPGSHPGLCRPEEEQKISSSWGMVSAHSQQLKSLIRLAEPLDWQYGHIYSYYRDE